jgi:hypothetical protein
VCGGGILVGNSSLLVGNSSNKTDVGGSIFDKTEFPPGFLQVPTWVSS